MAEKNDPKPNEVWQDAEGTLYTPAIKVLLHGVPDVFVGWFAFGQNAVLTPEYLADRGWTPTEKVAEADGTIVATRLNYKV